MNKICFIGKYPPIQGGVSSSTFWLLRTLANAGYEIHVVTNSWEVEEEYRLYLEGDDIDYLKNYYSPNGGKVILHNTNPFLRPKYIPSSPPYVSKLVSKCINVINQYHCDLIFSYYIEPYGVVGSIVSEMFKLPFIFKHAGSDITRLLQCPDMQYYYIEILKKADCILTTLRSSNIIKQILDSEESIDYLSHDFLPENIFNPYGNIMDISNFLMKIDRRIIDYKIYGWSTKKISGKKITIGVYCKASPTKGIEPLIKSLGHLVDKIDFNLVIITGGSFAQDYQKLVIEQGEKLVSYTRFIPFIAPWRIPEFIRACDIICCLETGFPIESHSPRIPREVLSCGTCLLISDEVFQKQIYRHKIINWENAIILNNPYDTNELTSIFLKLYEDKGMIKVIGKKGYEMFQSLNINNEEKVIENFRNVLEKLA